MTEDQHNELSITERRFLNSTVDETCDFNKYDPYIEKIRTLFVPSLEPRIYSYLETFIYPEDDKAISKPTYLKRCLNVTGNLHDPINSICTKFANIEFLDNMLAQTVKYLVKDGLINCFLNSIILNNRLNKVCQNLDSVGIEKNFLRYLAVWNYVNEKNYWMENDERVSMSDMSDDSIVSRSDLDVQVGSTIDARQTSRCINKIVRRRNSDQPCQNFCENGDIAMNRNANSESQKFLSRFSLVRKNSEGSSSTHVKRKPRSIGQTYCCRPSNCPTYRTEKSHQSVNWREKTLKLKISKIFRTTLNNETSKPIRLSKLPLPCKFDDIFAEIIKTDNDIPKWLSIATRKKLQPGLTSICHCINDTLGKMNREEIRRCRFHCEISTGLVTFKLFRRETNGCKVCLFTDRIAIEKINDQNSPRISLVNQTDDKMQKNLHDSAIPVRKSERLSDDSLQVSPNLPAESETQLEPQSSLPQAENNSEAIHKQKSNEIIAQTISNNFNENNVDDQMSKSKLSSADKRQSLLYEDERIPETSLAEGTEVDKNISLDPLEEGSQRSLCGNSPNAPSCYCNNSDDNKIELSNHESEINQEISSEEIKVSNATNDDTELTAKDSWSQMKANEVSCLPSCLCTIYSKTTDQSNSELNKTRDDNECIDKSIEVIEASNINDVHSSTIIEDCQPIGLENKNTDSVLVAEKDQQILMPQLDSSSVYPEAKKRQDSQEIISRGHIGCECPSETCACINKLIEDDSEDSQCCNSFDPPYKSNSLDCPNDVSRFSNLDQPSNTNRRISKPVETVFIKKKNKYIDTASNTQPQPNFVDSNSWESQNPKIHQTKSTRSKISCKPNVKNIPSVDTAMQNTRNSTRRSMQVQTENTKLANAKFKESRKYSPIPSIRIDTGRASSVKSQRINISIELCSESETTDEKSMNNEGIARSWQNDLTRCRRIQDFSSMSRCYSADARTSRKQGIILREKNTKDECLSQHPRRTNTWLHSPPQLLNSQDYPPYESPLRMRNPIMYGMSTKSNVRSASKFERQSIKQDKRRENKESKYLESKRHRRCCNETQETIQIEKPDESPNSLPRIKIKSDRISPSINHNKLCHAFSASSIDRMKHLIKTKLRKILLERDKATNTTKSCLSNDKYRVRVPKGKNKRLPFDRPRCHTIWESRSASDSANTSRTFGSNCRTSFDGVSQGDGIKTLFHSTAKSKTLEHLKNVELNPNFNGSNNAACSCLRNTEESLIASSITMNPRLVGGSDALPEQLIDCKFQYSFMDCQKSVERIVNNEIEYVSNNCNERLNLKIENLSCPEDSENVVDAAVMLSSSVNETKFDGHQDEIIKYPGKLDWSDTSTSRHIYLYEYNNFESSNDEEDKKSLNRKISSRPIDSLRISKRSQFQGKQDLRTSQKVQGNNSKEVKTRPHKTQLNKESRMHRNIRGPNLRPSTHATKSVKCQKGFGKLDQDLRSKLLQYVNVCKNVKYSLLKMLRPDDIYEVSRISMSCSDRYKFGDS